MVMVALRLSSISAMTWRKPVHGKDVTTVTPWPCVQPALQARRDADITLIADYSGKTTTPYLPFRGTTTPEDARLCARRWEPIFVTTHPAARRLTCAHLPDQDATNDRDGTASAIIDGQVNDTWCSSRTAWHDFIAFSATTSTSDVGCT
jgi:hypothetical protein